MFMWLAPPRIQLRGPWGPQGPQFSGSPIQEVHSWRSGRHLCFWSSLQSGAPRRMLKNKPQLKQLFRGESVEKTNHKGSSSSDARVFKNKPPVKHLFRSESKSTHDMRLMQHTQKKQGFLRLGDPLCKNAYGCLVNRSKP